MNRAEPRFAWAMALCTEARMRLSPLREAMLRFLAAKHLPASLEDISQADGVRDKCSITTVYRTLVMFKEAGLVRQIGTTSKTNYFVLNAPGENNHFLICRQCGCITGLPMTAALTEAIHHLATAHGFAAQPQDFELYGLCEGCERGSARRVTVSKLLV